MEHAIRYIELSKSFVTCLEQAGYTNIDIFAGRKFDRVTIDGAVAYFVDRATWMIYGAKSAVQYNPRWEYGTLETATQFDWTTNRPLPNTPAEQVWDARELSIVSGYKKRGRPRKLAPVGAP